MTPQRYEHLTERFHAALELAPDERAAFLDQVCDGDADLRRELESLLAAHVERAGYTEKPPDDIAAGMYLAQENGPAGAASLAPNTRLDRYEIRSLLAKGGMGEVYLAEDTTLRRLVALKLLPAAAAADKDRMRRFVQEAKAAAALSHPHIAQIFEIGEHDGTHFIAMELGAARKPAPNSRRFSIIEARASSFIALDLVARFCTRWPISVWHARRR